ncbi:MAG: FAD-binding protein, partial [Muribaculaceae bacterium]|nr:FAD-binding protein [Muribaculaceae bacterium]
MIQYDKDITSMTTFGIPAKAKYFAEYSSVKELREIIRSDEFQSSEIFHIGGGSNLLFLSDYDGLILHSAIRGITDYRKDDQTVYVIAGAGENWAQFVDWCVDHGYAGLENMAYIPGEVGASAIQNVGAYGVEAKDVIYKVECYD